MSFIRQALFISIIVCLAGCSKPELKEVSRVTSPDDIVDAIIAIEETDATVATPTLVYIVPKGGQIDRDGAVLVADHSDNASLKWSASKKLIVSIGSARIFSFQNFWQSGDVQNFQYKVDIYLNDENCP